MNIQHKLWATEGNPNERTWNTNPSSGGGTKFFFSNRKKNCISSTGRVWWGFHALIISASSYYVERPAVYWQTKKTFFFFFLKWIFLFINLIENFFLPKSFFEKTFQGRDSLFYCYDSSELQLFVSIKKEKYRRANVFFFLIM